MKKINEQFENFDYDEFNVIDDKITLKAIIIAGVSMIVILFACYGFITLIF